MLTTTTPQHAAMQQFEVQNDCLQIGGLPLPRLAQRVGCTPFYAYERRHIAERIALLRAALPAQVQLHYAMKANPMAALVQMMAGLVDGIDVASGGELACALDTTLDPRRISFAGPGKSQFELGCAVAAGVLINLESEAEMERVAIIGDQLGLTPRVAVR
ncbi:MAG: diaminopimelate decarboxylase, partial [Janthinobacterium sp.]